MTEGGENTTYGRSLNEAPRTHIDAALTSGCRAYVAGLALGALVLMFAGAISLPPLAAHGDFAEQWAAARMVLEGGHPYDPVTWRAGAARLAGRASDAIVFVYPPYVTLALVPLAALPLPIAATLWVGATLVIAALAVGALLRAYPPSHPLVAMMFGAALMSSTPSLLALGQGQWDFLLLAVVSRALVTVANEGRSSASALALLFKPQLAPLVLVAFARAATGRARVDFIAAGAVAVVLIAGTVVAVLPWWTAWLRGLTSFAAAQPIRTTTLASTLDALLGPASAIVLVAVIATVTAIGLALPSQRPATLAAWIATAVLIAPYIQTYDHLLLLAPLVVATSAVALRSGGASLAVAMVGVALLVFGDLAAAATTMARGDDLFGALIPLAIWALVTGVAWSLRAAAPR
jgi:hypothetical protein